MSTERSSSSPRRGGSGRGDGRRAGGSGGRGSGGGAKRSGGGGRGRSDRPALTDADRRAIEVKRRRGPKPEPDREAERAHERQKIEARTTEQWIDEGSVRDVARAAAARAESGAPARRGERRDAPVDPQVAAELSDALGAQRGARLAERLAQASDALDRERFDEAKRIAGAIAKEAPSVAAAHEIVGLAGYRLGRYKQAAASLETANDLHENPATLPVLADCYRAMERWAAVERVWLRIREASPAHEVLAEGRIVAAGALADRGDLAGAIEVMRAATKQTKKVRDHHLRQWYVLADLFDRSNDPINARRWFGTIASHDPDYFDVQTRLRHIGR